MLPAADWPQLERRTRVLLRQVMRKFPGAANQLPWTTGNLSDYLALQDVFASWLREFVATMLASGATASRLGQVDSRVLQALQTLDDLPVNRPLDQTWLAGEVRLSPSQLDRLFGKQFGLTPRQYFDRRKLGRAMDLIRGAPLSIKQIAYETGFRSLPYFSRWFQARTGLSPRAFKKVGR